MKKHTALPWATDGKTTDNPKDLTLVASFDLVEPIAQCMKAEDAEHIVKCVNSHEALVKALKLHQEFWDDMPKGQLGRIVCDIGILNDAFIKTREALNKSK